MNEAAQSLPEVMFRCRKYISLEIVSNDFLIDLRSNIADAITKKNPNTSLLQVLKSNSHVVPCKRVFMLQHSLYGHATFIPTSHVPMPEDLHLSQSHQKHHSSLSSRAALPFPLLKSGHSSTSPH